MELFGEGFDPLVVFFPRLGIEELFARPPEPVDLDAVCAGVRALLLGDVVLAVGDDAAGGASLAGRIAPRGDEGTRQPARRTRESMLKAPLRERVQPSAGNGFPVAPIAKNCQERGRREYAIVLPMGQVRGRLANHITQGPALTYRSSATA